MNLEVHQGATCKNDDATMRPSGSISKLLRHGFNFWQFQKQPALPEMQNQHATIASVVKKNNANVVLTIIVCIQQAVLIGTSGPRHGNLVFVYNSIAVSCKVDLPRFTLLKTYFQQNQLTRVQLVCPARPARLGTRNRICSCWTQSCTVQCCNQKWGCVKCSLQFGLWRMDGRTDSERERDSDSWMDRCIHGYKDTRIHGWIDR
jgi:hypothetical protein